MPAHPFTNFEIQEYCKNEPRFNGVYSRDNLLKTIKNETACVVNLDKYNIFKGANFSHNLYI